MTYDFLIIGGGVAGLGVAQAIAPLGRTLVLEREDQLGYHASGRSAALFIADYGNDVVCALNAASLPLHHAAGVLTRRDMMAIARHHDGDQLDREAADLGLSRIGLDDAERMFPILDFSVVGHAAHRADTFDLDTDALMQHFARQAHAAGADIKKRAEVSAITKLSGGAWQVSCTDGRSFTAGHIVNAAGAWADEIAKLAGIAPVGLIPYRRSMAQLPAMDGIDTSDWAFIDEVHDRWYAKPQSGKLIVSPKEAVPVAPHDAYVDDMDLAEGLARFEELVTMQVTRVEHSWAGLRSFAPDNTLVIGRDAAEPGFIWCAGQGGYGFQTGPAAAQLVGQIMAETQPTLDAATVAALSPARFTA